MSEATTRTEAAREARREIPAPHPAGILLQLIVSLLAPLFLGVTGGDADLARLAALETIRDYRTRDGADLLAAAQIIAFGLAALGSLSLSFDDDISVTMALRLRGNANACNRSAEQNRRSRNPSHAPAPVHADVPERPEPPGQTAEPPAPPAEPPAEPRAEPPVQAAAQPAGSPRRAEAIAMLKQALQIDAGIPGLAVEQRKAASLKVAALSSTANHLLASLSQPAKPSA